MIRLELAEWPGQCFGIFVDPVIFELVLMGIELVLDFLAVE